MKIFIIYFSERGLFPSVNNLALNAIISANATCGESGPEVYCKLVEHVFMRFVFISCPKFYFYCTCFNIYLKIISEISDSQ